MGMDPSPAAWAALFLILILFLFGGVIVEVVSWLL
jgi:hypothetical protein